MTREDIKVLDPGHKYKVTSLGSDKDHIEITFIKKIGDKYPGNKGTAYPGVTMQMVLRVLLDRLSYVNNQKPCKENILIGAFLELSIWLLEFRAAKHNGLSYFKSLKFASKSKMCKVCGHTVCNH